MKFVKQYITALPQCYAALQMTIGGEEYCLFATDAEGSCVAVNMCTLATELVWQGPGGTMSMVPLPSGDGEFFASQRFMPGFHAKNARIVHAKRTADKWQVTPWLTLPYVHRFDLIEKAGRLWFLGCILTETDAESADWESPGKLIVAELNAELQPPNAFVTIARNMHRNHGYCRSTVGGEEWLLTACDEGVFRVFPPDGEAAEWQVRRLTDTPASDVAICDLDGDGKQELIVISPFHGDTLNVYHERDGEYACVYCAQHSSSFLHAIWAGELCGENVALVGGRAGARETLLLQWTQGAYNLQEIESGYGASNFFVQGNRILIANREAGECAILKATESD